MYLCLNSYIFIRCIDKKLAITNSKDNFTLFGDYSSYFFLKNLSHWPQHIDDISKKIAESFTPRADIAEVKKDAIELFSDLNKNGILAIGSTAEECRKNIKKFSYSEIDVKNFKPAEDKIQKAKKPEKPHALLTSLAMEITSMCNERCIHCYIPHETKNAVMSEHDFYRIINLAAENEAFSSVSFTGGECMSHPSFKKFVRYVKGKGFAAAVMSNLTLLDDEMIDIFADGGQTNVAVSLFSLNPAIHDKITSLPGSWHKTMENIKKLKKADIPVSLSTQAMEINKDSFADLYAFAEDNGFRIACDWTISCRQNGDTDNLGLRIKDLSCYKDICMVRLQHSSTLKEEICEALQGSLKTAESPLCTAGKNKLYVCANLDVQACPGWDMPVGNLKKESLSDIWEKSEKLKQVRAATLGSFPKCVQCKNNVFCFPCMSFAYKECKKDGYFEMPEYFCKIQDIIRETAQE